MNKTAFILEWCLVTLHGIFARVFVWIFRAFFKSEWV